MMVQQVEQLSTSYPHEWDDRVFCHECKHCSAVPQRKSMPAELMEKIRKVNAKPLQWMLKEAKIKNGWATVTWTEHQCSPTGFAVFPRDVKHRCHMYQAKPSAVESEEWWLT
jgi:hypothetical protein